MKRLVGWGILLVAGLTGLLLAPLPVLRLLVLPALWVGMRDRRWRHAFLHLVPFWALLVLPVGLGMASASSPERILWRSLLSLIWVTAGVRVLSTEQVLQALAHLPPAIRMILLIAWRQQHRIRARLTWGIRAYRLTGDRRVHVQYGALLGRLLLRLDAQSDRMAHALRLRHDAAHD